MAENAAVATTPMKDGLEFARRGMRSCLDCRTTFPNRLALMKHSLHGCRKWRK